MQDGTIVGGARPAAEGTWNHGWGIEIPCKYVYVKTESKDNVRNILNKH